MATNTLRSSKRSGRGFATRFVVQSPAELVGGDGQKCVELHTILPQDSTLRLVCRCFDMGTVRPPA